MPRRKIPTVFVVSDGRGSTATQVLEATAAQYEGQRYKLILCAKVRTPERVASTVERAAKLKAPIFYTLVSEKTRLAMRRAAADHLVPTVDILGPSFRALHDVFRSRRESIPGLLYTSDRERLDRLDAIDYTLKHDDGQRPHELSRADVVLVGVSRSGKSSACFVLAYVGVRAANVPLVAGLEPPGQLLALAPKKVIGLRINVSRLITVREVRVHQTSLPCQDAYLDKRTVSREVLGANRLLDKNDWRSIDVSYMAIEEIAKEILRLRNIRARLPL